MDNTLKEQLDALTGGADENAKPVETTDYKQLYENLLGKVKADDGRVNKAKAEAEAARKELEELKATRGKEDALSSLSAEEREAIAPEVLEAIAKVAGKSREDADRRIREFEERRNMERAANAEEAGRRFLERIDSEFPGFRASIAPGGGNEDAWRKFRDGPYRASIKDAMARSDINTLAYFVRQFYTESLKSKVPSKDGDAAPDPSAFAGGNISSEPADYAKSYTQEEYAALEKRAEDLRRSGRFEEYRKISLELDSILSEGRLKG